MDKRFLSFLWTALLVILLYTTAQQMLVRPKAVQPAHPANPVGEAGDAPELANQGKPAGENVPAAVDPTPDLPPNDQTNVGAAKATPPAPVASADLDSLRRYTLGSLDPNSGHVMLVTLSNQGATIERIELNAPKYTDVDDRAGYLGELGLENDPQGGCRVTVVGAGTPAALATSDQVDQSGLRGPVFELADDGTTHTKLAGDVIRKINSIEIANTDDFNRALSATNPGQSLQIEVIRSNSPSDQELSQQRIVFTAKLRKRPVAVLQPEPFVIEEDTTPDPLSFPMTLQHIGDTKLSVTAQEFDKLPSLKKGRWKSKGIADNPQGMLTGVEFSYPLSAEQLAALGIQNGRMELVKRYLLKDAQAQGNQDPQANIDNKARAVRYELLLEIELRNQGDEPLKAAYVLDGPSGLPLEGWWYSIKVHPSRFSAAGIRDVVYRAKGAGHEMITGPSITQHAMANPKSPAKPLAANAAGDVEIDYIGGDAQFFAAVLMPSPATEAADPFAAAKGYSFQNISAVSLGELDKKQKKRTNVSFRLSSTPELIPPQGALRHRFTIFAGPKDPDLLDPIGLGECIVYGWFKVVARPMVGILHGLYWLSGSFSYGIAIVLLTVLVRGAMYPLGRKMAQNAQKMQELAPELKKIADQYKEDMEKRANAQRELFRKHKYNPLSGCFVMFFQLPVFVGLYRALSVDIRLRQAPLLPGISWCSNLAGPDRLWHWQDTFLPAAITSPTGFMGPYLNILPFFSFALMMVHQKMFTPPPQDEQQKMQMQIMNVMMVFFAVMFHKVAAGLCIYFIVSSLWGLGERLLLGKYRQPAAAPTK